MESGVIKIGKNLIKFSYYGYQRRGLGKISNVLVRIHFEFSPNRSVVDTGNEILLEEVRAIQRKIEKRRWNLWVKMEDCAKEMGIYDEFKDLIKLHEQEKQQEFSFDDMVAVEKCKKCEKILANDRYCSECKLFTEAEGN